MKNIRNLKKCFEEAIECNAEFIGISIENEDYKETEVIINKNANFKDKLEYYLSAYNEDLTLKTNPKIKIVEFEYSDYIGKLEELFY